MWTGDFSALGPVALYVRCQGRRIFAVGFGDPAPVAFPPGVGDTVLLVLDGIRLGEEFASRNWGFPPTTNCPNHRYHQLDGAKLRDTYLPLVRPGHTASVDVGRVVVRQDAP